MTWHDDANVRKKLGDQAEDLFAKEVTCRCGGSFNYIGHIKKGFPDFACSECDQFVDIKISPQAERTGNLSVSAIPWDGYPDNMLLVTRIHGMWIGEYKKFIVPINSKPYDPTHNSSHPNLGNTQWYLIPWEQLHSLDSLGFKVRLSLE